MNYLLSVAALALVSASALAMPPGDMPAYCRSQAARDFATKPIYIKVGQAVRLKSGGYSVKGTANLGHQGKKPFACDFGKKGEFLHIKSLVDEGAL